MNDWSNFFIGELGAAAALAGLLFVAVSVNQARILQLGRMAVCNQLSLITIALGGVVTLWRGRNGLYLLPPGILATFLFSIANAWVLLIEINR